MAHCLSNVSLSHHQVSSSHRISLNTNHFRSRIPQSLSSVGLRNFHHKGIKAVAGNGANNLDHLQRANKQQLQRQPQQQQQLQQPKKRVAQVAPTRLWDRFPTARTVQQMMETMERMMEDPLFYGSGRWPVAAVPETETGRYSRGRTPWEIKEGEAEYKMRFDMPGMTKEDVKVWVEEKMLVVKAEKIPKKKKSENGEMGGEEEEEDEEEWPVNSYGRYSTRIALPEKVDQFEKIKAEVKDGVLYITIPKASGSAKVLDINVQ